MLPMIKLRFTSLKKSISLRIRFAISVLNLANPLGEFYLNLGPHLYIKTGAARTAPVIKHA